MTMALRSSIGRKDEDEMVIGLNSEKKIQKVQANMTWGRGRLDLTSFGETNQPSQWLVEMWRWRVLIPWADAMQGKYLRQIL